MASVGFPSIPTLPTYHYAAPDFSALANLPNDFWQGQQIAQNNQAKEAVSEALKRGDIAGAAAALAAANPSGALTAAIANARTGMGSGKIAVNPATGEYFDPYDRSLLNGQTPVAPPSVIPSPTQQPPVQRGQTMDIYPSPQAAEADANQTLTDQERAAVSGSGAVPLQSAAQAGAAGGSDLVVDGYRYKGSGSKNDPASWEKIGEDATQTAIPTIPGFSGISTPPPLQTTTLRSGEQVMTPAQARTAAAQTARASLELRRQQAGKLTGQEAGSTAMLMAGATALDSPAAKGSTVTSRELLLHPESWGIAQGITSVAPESVRLTNSPEIVNAQAAVKTQVEAALRMMTGAAAPDQEVVRYAKFFTPGIWDKDETASAKLQRLDDFTKYALQLYSLGRTIDLGEFTKQYFRGRGAQ